MTGWGPVGSIHRRSYSGSGDEDGPEFIGYMDRREPQIHKVWTFGEDGVTREVHLTARVDSRAGFVGEFSTNYPYYKLAKGPYVWSKLH